MSFGSWVRLRKSLTVAAFSAQPRLASRIASLSKILGGTALVSTLLAIVVRPNCYRALRRPQMRCPIPCAHDKDRPLDRLTSTLARALPSTGISESAGWRRSRRITLQGSLARRAPGRAVVRGEDLGTSPIGLKSRDGGSLFYVDDHARSLPESATPFVSKAVSAARL